MAEQIFGGNTTYGQLAGILMTDSVIPRIPGDPGHAETLPFPVRYGIIKGFPFEDLIHIKKDNLHIVIDTVKTLEKEGVNFIAADCGLFAPFQQDIVNHLSIPFIGSALDLIPLLSRFLPPDKKIGVITGDTRILKEAHLKCSGADISRLVITGMEKSSEFKSVVLERGNVLNKEAMRQGAINAAKPLVKIKNSIGAVILECSNLATFRSDIQKLLKVPVYDIVSLIEFFSSGYRIKKFDSDYI